MKKLFILLLFLANIALGQTFTKTIGTSSTTVFQLNNMAKYDGYTISVANGGGGLVDSAAFQYWTGSSWTSAATVTSLATIPSGSTASVTVSGVSRNFIRLTLAATTPISVTVTLTPLEAGVTTSASTLSNPTISGTVAGSPTITTPTLTTPIVTGVITVSDTIHGTGALKIDGNSTLTGTTATTGKVTFGGNLFNLTLHAIVAGDSVFGHVILDAADTTIKAWNGAAWITIKDLIP